MNNSISEKQYFTLLSSFFLGNSLAVTGGIWSGEKIGFITLFASFILYIGLCFIYRKIFRKQENSDLFEISNKLLGDFLYKIFLVVILIYSLLVALSSSVEFLFFVELSSDFSIPTVWVALLFSICVFCLLICDKKALARYSEIILPFVLFILIFVLVMGLKKAEFSNLKIENMPNSSYITNSIVTNFISPFSHILLVYFFISDMISHKKIKNISIFAGGLSLFVIWAVYIVNLLVLGKNLMGSLYFPTLYTFGVINPNVFAERSETVFYVTYIFFDVLYTTLAYFVFISCLKRLINKKNTFSQKSKKIFCLIPFVLSFTVMNLKIDVDAFFSSFSYISYIFGGITILTPVILLIISNFKKTQFNKPDSDNEIY